MTDICMDYLNKWIVQQKKEIWTRETTSGTPQGILQYRESLLALCEQLMKAIRAEDAESLARLNWPTELMDCIKDMGIRVDIVETLEQALTIHQFNRSPEHEEELRKENAGLM